MKKLILSVTVVTGLSMTCRAQTGDYQYTGSEKTIILNPGTYDITAYGAQGGNAVNSNTGGLGAEMAGQFYFPQAESLTILVGGGGGSSSVNGGGGGGGTFVVNGTTPLVVAGGGGGGGVSESGGGGGIGSVGGNGGGNYGGGYGGGQGGGGSGGAGEYYVYPNGFQIILNAGGGGGGYSGAGGGGGFSGIGGSGGSSYLDAGGGGSGLDTAGSGGYGGGGGASAGGGGGGGYGGGGGGSGVSNGSGSGGGGGGGSIIDSSAIADLAEVSGIGSPDDSPNGEVIIIAVPPIPALGITTVGGLPVVTWPSAGTNYTLQMTTNLTSGNWVPFTNGIPFNDNPFFGLEITNGPAAAYFRLY